MSRVLNDSIVDGIHIHNHTDEEVIQKGFGLMSISELKELPTHRLLAYYKKRVQLLPSVVSSWGRCECCGERLVSTYNKENDERRYRSWEIAEKIADKYKDRVKELLNEREHIE